MSRRTGRPAGRAAGRAVVLALVLGMGLSALAAPAAARAALAVHAEVDRSELAQDEVLTLEVRVEADEPASVALPARDFDFQVVSQARSQSTSVDLGGGAGVRIRRTTLFQYGLAPLKTGDLTIPAIEVTSGKATASTEPIGVKVTPPGTGGGAGAGRGGRGSLGGPGGSPLDPFGMAPPGAGGGSRSWNGWERDLRLVVELDKAEAFVGEQVTASVFVLSPAEVVRTEGYQPPVYDGFWNETLEQATQLRSTLRKNGGVPLRAYLLERVALFPTRAGELELGPFGVDVVLQLGPANAFYPFPELRRARRQSRAATLRVKPLPPGAPAGFDPANVGSATFTAALSETRVATGQPVTLRLTAWGDGNVKGWALPPVPAIASLRAFAPTTVDKVAPKGQRLTGQRTVETVLVPQREGTFTIPPLAWPVFDPKLGRYEVLRSPELSLEVATPAPAAAAGSGAPAPLPGQNALAAGLRPIRTGGALSRRGEPPWQGSLMWLLVGGPVVLFAAGVAVDRIRDRRAADGGARRLRQAGRVARRRLAEASRLAGGAEDAPFFTEVERALSGYCADKLGRPAAGLTRDELARALAEAGAHAPALRALAAALDACDAGRFGGATGRDEVLSLASRAMELLEEAHWQAPGGAA